MTGLENLPSAIADFFDATNHSDRERFLAAFAADAVLDDWGRSFHGHDGISTWNENENMGVQSHFEVEGFTETNGVYAVAIRVTGNGYNGGGTMAFALDGDGDGGGDGDGDGAGAGARISRVDITG